MPVKVGEAERTRLVEPVEPVTSESEETRSANGAEVPRVPPVPVVTNLEPVSPEKVIAPEEVSPVRPDRVPAIVEAPVTLTPPEETVSEVKVGEAAKTRSPVPVVPETEDNKLAEEIVLVRFFEALVATRRLAVRAAKVAVLVTFRVLAVRPLLTAREPATVTSPSASILNLSTPATATDIKV